MHGAGLLQEQRDELCRSVMAPSCGHGSCLHTTSPAGELLLPCAPLWASSRQEDPGGSLGKGTVLVFPRSALVSHNKQQSWEVK